jgi:hypothetical protein
MFNAEYKSNVFMNSNYVRNNPLAVYHVLRGSIIPTERQKIVQEAQPVNRDSK